MISKSKHLTPKALANSSQVRAQRETWVGFASKVLVLRFSVQPLCSLCLCGVFLLGIHQPQRHRVHRGRTEKSAVPTFRAKLIEHIGPTRPGAEISQRLRRISN